MPPRVKGGSVCWGTGGGARKKLAEAGVYFGLSMDTVYQTNAHGGLDTHSAHYGTGMYDFELILDLEEMLGVEGGAVYALAEGGFGDGLEGADKVGDFFGVNDNAVGYRSLDLIELWYQQDWFDQKLQMRLGKIDLSGGFECRGCPVSFDGNYYANDATSQFLNSALVNNPTIPFPDNGLGMIVHFNPLEWFYASVGAADAQGDARETGMRTATTSVMTRGFT